MSYLKRNAYSERAIYNVVYENMKGVDFSESGTSVKRNRFAYLENMYRDYEGNGKEVIESIPGYRKIYDFGKRINGLFSYKDSSGYDVMVVHAENSLHEFYVDDRDSIFFTTETSGIKDTESTCFVSNDSAFVMDGENIFKISDGYRGKISDSDGGIYVPTTYLNGIEYEQRNLLTRRFKESYLIGTCDSDAFATPSLKYEITDAESAFCKITGMDGSETKLYIPSRALIGDKYYRVKSIDAKAFKDNTAITECYIAEGVSYIGTMAFHNCYNIEKIILPDSVTEIDTACFSGCEKLSSLHFGAGLRKIGTSAINTCPLLTKISYSGTQNDFESIENVATLGDTEIIYEQKTVEIMLGIALHSPCVSVERVCVRDTECEFSVIKENDLCLAVTVKCTDKSLFEGREVVIEGHLSENPEHYTGAHRSFITSNFKMGKSIKDVILGCTVAESFDGRIFLTGNPEYPGFTFYSSPDTSGENNPLYFGELNYFKDGVGSFANVALLASGDSIAVFKERDDGGGSIYYHTPEATFENLIPKIYPVSYVHTGLCAKGGAISFFDDPVFISERGLSALTKRTVNLERSISTRSTNVNPKLLTEELEKIKLCVWRGYLALMAKDKIYLADSRDVFVSDTGEIEYEWYFISGIGSRKGAKSVYRYASESNPGYLTHPNTDGKADGEVLGVFDGEKIIYYVVINGEKYEVYKTEELSGGDFYPPTHTHVVKDLLFFATEIGELFLFNNDKRGAAPPSVSQTPNFDKEEYESSYGRRIHPYYYSFAGHAPRYALKTKKDDCSIPHLTKKTVKNSLALKCRTISAGKICCEVGTDGTGYREICTFPNRDMFFADVDFGSFSLNTEEVCTVPVHEKSKNWIEKQITLYADEYGSPFGIYTIAYRFFVKGQIKKK